MRALEALAEAYRAHSVNMDAIRIYDKMLKLNPNVSTHNRPVPMGLRFSSVAGIT